VTPRLVRAVVLVVCAAGVAGMIVASVVGADGAALTFGLITAAAVACLVVATAVGGAAVADDERAAVVESLVGRLVDEGADETTVRQLVREATHLPGHGSRRP
jgi:hypothetical protein